MTDSAPAQERQQGCGLTNCLIPLFAVPGAIIGWRIGFLHGIGWGVAGAVIGVTASVPATALVLLVILGTIELPKVFRR